MRDLVLLLRNCRPVWPGAKPQPPKRKAIAGHKCCNSCEQDKPESEFYITSRMRKDGSTPVRSICKRCEIKRVTENRRG